MRLATARQSFPPPRLLQRTVARMLTCEYAGPAMDERRSHPWVDSVTDPSCRYYDLKANPADIRSSLEDFVLWEKYAAIHTFYGVVKRLNAPLCALESNDCAFQGPAAHSHEGIDKSLECSGRVMVLFRHLKRNTVADQVCWLKEQLHLRLQDIDTPFQWGMIGTTLVPVRFLALPSTGGQQNGQQLMISFWAWGDTEASNMQNLARLMRNLSCALMLVSRQADLEWASA